MAATARAIPKADVSVPKTVANPTGFGFGTMYPSLGTPRPGLLDLEGIIGRRCVNYFTLRISIILMETIKDLIRDSSTTTPPASP
jgi:hypothetical protein